MSFAKPLILGAYFTGFFCFLSQAKNCDLDKIPLSQESAMALLELAAKSLESDKCTAAISLIQARDLDPALFIQTNGLFTFMRLAVELEQFEAAKDAYQSWPWENERFNPWNFVPEGQEDGTELIIWKVFARFVPKRATVCIHNHLTHKCDSGEGLANYDQVFKERYPDSPFREEIKQLVAPFYRYKWERELSTVIFYIKQYNSYRDKSKKGGLRHFILTQISKISDFAKPQDRILLQQLRNKL